MLKWRQYRGNVYSLGGGRILDGKVVYDASVSIMSNLVCNGLGRVIETGQLNFMS